MALGFAAIMIGITPMSALKSQSLFHWISMLINQDKLCHARSDFSVQACLDCRTNHLLPCAGHHELAVRQPDILKSTAKAAFEMLGKEDYYVDTATAHLLR